MNLFDYFTGLAPAGETALIVKQIDTGKHHADGKRKYTWPAYYPTHKRKAGESWFLNTGSFIKDRMPEKPSAALANCTHVLFLMLDDIGETKVYDGESVVIKTPPVKPTAIVETSEGSYQYWFAYSEQPTVEEQTVFVEALGAADYTDRGARNAVRNCRLPGSVNRKPGKEEFICREVEFNPGVEYTIQELIAAFGVTPAEPGTARAITFRVKDNGADTVLAWLSENSLVLSGTNAAGWCGVVCPNHAEHTDGSIEARYKPQDRSFCCHHGHCDGLDSKFFCDWVAEQGGPRAIPGLRDDLIAEYTSKINKLTPTEEFPDEAAVRIAETERKQAGREDRATWHKRFAYVIDDDGYFDHEMCSEISRRAFNALFRHIECKSVGAKPRRLEASNWYDENREAMKGYALKGMTYAAGDEWKVQRDGLVYGNVWRDARPEIKSPSDPQLWIDHCRRLVPDERELNHIWDVMAVKLQQPRTKINHAVLHGGNGGIGKDTMWYPFLWAIGGDHMKNVKVIDGDKITSDFGYHYQTEVMVLNELKEPEARERRALANRLKPVIAAPPEMLTVNRKGLHPYEMPNRIFLLAFTNESMPITLDSDDRRWFCVWSDAPKMTSDETQRIWGWYKNGGFEAVAGWLQARDVSAFNPKAIPFTTEYKQRLVYTGMSNAESFIYHLIEKREAPFNTDVIAGPWHNIIKIISDAIPVNSHLKIVQPALLHALKETGWVDKGLCLSTTHKSKRHIFVRPELADLPKSHLRDMVEPGGADNVVPLRHS
jgi:hypothetical protein